MTLRIGQIIVLLTFLAVSLGLAGCSQKVTIRYYPASPMSENQSTTSMNNIISQSENITSQDDVNVIDIDKRTGKRLRDDSTVITLTPEQWAIIDKIIEEKSSWEDTSQIKYPSGYSITTTPNTIETSIKYKIMIPASNYYVMQFYTDLSSVDPETRDILQQSGCVLYDYMDSHAFYAKIPPEALDTVISMIKNREIRYLGRVPVEAKIDKTLLNEAWGNPFKSIRVVVYIMGDLKQSDVEYLKNYMQIDSYLAGSEFVYGIARGFRIKKIATLNFVNRIQERRPVRLF